MIIGNNTNFNNDNNNFTNKFRAVAENSENQNTFMDNKETNKYTNITNNNEMVDKSFQILKDRLDNGLITLDEFNKKCQQINKLRK